MNEIEAIELDNMCVSEIVAKYESSHNAITVLKRKLREACESDEWMKSATGFYENGGCPICFSTDEAGCKKGCYLGQLQQKNEDYENALANQALTLLREKPEPDYTKNIRANLKRWNLEKIGDCRVKSVLVWLEEVCFRYDYVVERNAKLQAKLEQCWVPVSEIPKNDSYHIVTDGSKCEWLYFNETWFYAENKKPYPRFFMLKFYWPISLPEQPPIGNR